MPEDGQFVDMRMDPNRDTDMDLPMVPRTPDYPFGLRICLTHDELAKLGIEDDPDVGDLLHMEIMAEVTSYTNSDGESGPQRRVELQIKMIAHAENESTEFDDEDD